METTNTIAIYGKSGHGKVVADIAQLNGFTTIIWVDDNNKNAISSNTFLNSYKHIKIIVAIGDNSTRLKISNLLEDKGATLLSLLHPNAVISSSVIVKKGSVIMANVVINADAKIGKAVILNSASIIEHDCEISNGVHISPNVALAGNVRVDICTHIGIGSSVIQGISIGKYSIVGAGSVVIRNVNDKTLVVGVPAKYKKDLHV